MSDFSFFFLSARSSLSLHYVFVSENFHWGLTMTWKRWHQINYFPVNFFAIQRLDHFQYPNYSWTIIKFHEVSTPAILLTTQRKLKLYAGHVFLLKWLVPVTTHHGSGNICPTSLVKFKFHWALIEHAVEITELSVTTPQTNQLWTTLDHSWIDIPMQRAQHILGSMLRPLAAVIQANWGATHYLVTVYFFLSHVNGQIMNWVIHTYICSYKWAHTHTHKEKYIYIYAGI